MRRALLVWSALLIGCGGSTAAKRDGGVGTGGIAGADAADDRPAIIDAGPDVTVPDVAGETAPPDSAPDVRPDAAPDSTPDVAPDTARDTTPGDAINDAREGGPEVPPWTATSVLLTADKAIDLFVARDERHVAYSLTRANPLSFGCLGRNGTGDLKVLATDPTPATFAIDSLAGFNESRFTDDSQYVVFTQYTASSNPCAGFVGLRYAPSGSSAASGYLFSGAYYYHNISVTGSTVTWLSFGSASNDPGTRAARKINGSGSSFGQTSSYIALDPTGNSVLYDAGGELRVATLSGTTKFVLNDGSLGPTAGGAWSPDGTMLAYGYHETTSTPTGTLTVRNADGSNLRTIATDCRCAGVAFSPDSTQLAYDVTEADGSVTFVVRPVAGGPAVRLPGVQVAPNFFGYQRVAFSPDARWFEVINPGNFAVYIAPLAPPGPFVMLSSAGAKTNGSFTWTANHDHVAFTEVDAAGLNGVVVAAATGQHARPVASGVNAVWYEQTGTSPSLMVAIAATTAGPTTMTLFPTDGSGSGKALPVPSLPYTPTAFWVGPVFVYPTNQRVLSPSGSGSMVDLIAVSDDGSQTGALDTDVLTQPKTGRTDATRLFYARAPASGGGLYMFAPPTGTGGTGGTGGAGGRAAAAARVAAPARAVAPARAAAARAAAPERADRAARRSASVRAGPRERAGAVAPRPARAPWCSRPAGSPSRTGRTRRWRSATSRETRSPTWSSPTCRPAPSRR